MKKLFFIPLLLVIISGCTSDAPTEENDILVYFAKGETWAATYTLIDAEETIFDSLYIQHIGDRDLELEPIEYSLEGSRMKQESQYPRELQSVRSFQESGEHSKEVLNNIKDKDEEYKLTIKQSGGSEELILRLIKE